MLNLKTYSLSRLSFSLFACLFYVLFSPYLLWGKAQWAARPLPGTDRPAALARELFSRWMKACGGESRWKGVIDIDFRLKGTQSVDVAGATVTGNIYDRHVYIKLQPRLRMKSVFIDPENRLKTIHGRDGRGWFCYRENVPVGKGRPDNRRPDVYDDFKTKEEVSYALKGFGFWLGIPFILQLPEVKLRFVGYLKPSDVPPDSEEVKRPLPILELDLTGLNDWPIDMITVAFHPETFLPVEARYRFAGEAEADQICVFHSYKTIDGITYPAVRFFYKEGAPGDLEEVMSNVRINSHIHQSHFKRPPPMTPWH